LPVHNTEFILILCGIGDKGVKLWKQAVVKTVPVVRQLLYLSWSHSEVGSQLSLECKLLVKSCPVYVRRLEHVPSVVVGWVVKSVIGIVENSIELSLITNRVVN
jgi:hypothetical protein